MRKVRAAIRFVLFSLLSLFCYLALMLFSFLRLKDQGRKRFLKIWGIGTAFIIGLKIRSKGKPPEAPYLFIANHLGYLDAIALATRLDDPATIVKSEVSQWPGFGMFSKAFGSIYIDRKKLRDILRVNQLIEEKYQDQQGILFFPEGTSSSGESVLPFKSPLFEPAAKNKWPIHYGSIEYQVPKSEVPAALSVCWWGDMEFLPHLWQLLQLPSMEAKITFVETPLLFDDRKTAAKKLREKVERQLLGVPSLQQKPQDAVVNVTL